MDLETSSQVQANQYELQVVPRGHGQLGHRSPVAQAPVGQGHLNQDHLFNQYQSPPPHHHQHPPQHIQTQSHGECRKVFLYTRRPRSIRSVARQAYDDYVRHRRVDPDIQKWALLIGDDYYEAVRAGSQLEVRQYHYGERRSQGWDGSHRKFLLGCTALDNWQIAERGMTSGPPPSLTPAPVYIAWPSELMRKLQSTTCNRHFSTRPRRAGRSSSGGCLT